MIHCFVASRSLTRVISCCCCVMMLSEWYLQACALWPYSERLLFMVVSFLAHEVPFITINLFFYVVYRMRYTNNISATNGISCVPATLLYQSRSLSHTLTQSLSLARSLRWFEKYRLPRKHQPSWPLIKEALQALFVGHFIAQWFIIYLFYDLLKYQGMVVIGPLPSLATFVWQLILMLAINDTLFYWAHRLLHTPVLYRAIHKRHHRFTATVGIASEFAHPVRRDREPHCLLSTPYAIDRHSECSGAR